MIEEAGRKTFERKETEDEFGVWKKRRGGSGKRNSFLCFEKIGVDISEATSLALLNVLRL